MKRLAILSSAACALALAASAVPASAHSGGTLKTIAEGFDGPRGVATVRPGTTLVSETDGTINVVHEHRRAPATVRELTSVPATFAPAVARGHDGTVYIVTGAAGGPPEEGAPPVSEEVLEASNTLFKWRPGWAKPKVLANIGAYQAEDPDPYDLEDTPEESNAFGVVALRNGNVLVADAAGNDLLRVTPRGHVSTVAVLKPRTVEVPEGAGGPEGPPAGAMLPAEAVPTSVTVGSDGYFYVGELRGFPATPGTSQIWRIKPGSTDAVCDPEKPFKGACKRYADGLTSVVDLAAGPHGSIYALTLSKLSWLAFETQVPGAEIGGLFKVSRWGHHVRELAKDQLTLPGGVDTDYFGRIYVAGPVFGPGTLSRLR
jgi:hypothetical protein